MYIKDDRNGFPVRKNPRMANYNYATPNYYFVTICTRDKKCIFNGYSGYKEIAEKGLRDIPKHFTSVQVDKYIVMPNHVHAIIVLEEGAKDLFTIIGQYKSYVTRCVHGIDPKLDVWQTSFHDHVIRNQQSYERIWNYIDGNKQKWKEDCYFKEE